MGSSLNQEWLNDYNAEPLKGGCLGKKTDFQPVLFYFWQNKNQQFFVFPSVTPSNHYFGSQMFQQTASFLDQNFK